MPGLYTNTLQIGARGDDKCCHLTGTLDEVAFYNGQALSAARVQAHYAQGHCAADQCPTPACTAADVCHAAGVRDPATGICSNPARPDGTACGVNGYSCQGAVCRDSTASVYAAAVLADAPSGYWRLGEVPGSTVAADSSGNARDGAVVGGAVDFGAPGLISSVDTAASFTGGGYISVPAATAFAPAGAFSIEAWLKPVGDDYIVEKYDVPGSRGYALRITSGKLMLFVASASNAFVLSDAPVALGVTHHFVGTVDATGLGTLYLDGVAVKSAQVGLPSPGLSTNTMQIGARGDDKCCHLTGVLDEVAFYDGQALPAARVAAHYAAGR